MVSTMSILPPAWLEVPNGLGHTRPWQPPSSEMGIPLCEEDYDHGASFWHCFVGGGFLPTQIAQESAYSFLCGTKAAKCFLSGCQRLDQVDNTVWAVWASFVRTELRLDQRRSKYFVERANAPANKSVSRNDSLPLTVAKSNCAYSPRVLLALDHKSDSPWRTYISTSATSWPPWRLEQRDHPQP